MILRRAAERISEFRAADPRLPWGNSVPPTNGELGLRPTAEQIGAVYGCCGLIADQLSSLPLQLRNGPDKATSRRLPASPLVTQPYAEISLVDWWTQFAWGLALHGNFVGEIIERDRLGYPVQIKPIADDRWKVRRTQSGAIEYRLNDRIVPLQNVFHVRYQSQPGMIAGISPIQACALAFRIAINQDRYADSFFQNSGDPRGVIQVPGPLDQVETKKFLRGWIASKSGASGWNTPAILTEGAIWNPISMNAEETQMVAALGFSESRICGRIFRVPPHMVGMVEKASSWGKGIEAQERGFFTNTLIGYLTRGALAMSTVHPKGQFVSFDTSERLRGEALERAQVGSLMMLAGAWCADDVRDTFDMANLPNGAGKYTYAPVNTELLLQALQMLQQSKEQPPPAEPDDETFPPEQKFETRRTNGNGHGSRAHAIESLRALVGRR